MNPEFLQDKFGVCRKRTDRTRSCDACHVERSGFLKKETLLEKGSKANEGLIMAPKPINR